MKKTLAILAAGAVLCAITMALAAENAPVLDPVKKAVEPAVRPFGLDQVRLLDGPCKAAQDANGKYLLELSPDRLLRNFRVNAGLPAPGKPCGGWEAPDCELRGHFVGHYVSACSLMYKSTGDKRFKDRADLMVTELAKCQKALGGKYLSAFPESFFDKLESREEIWAPYYTIHKIMAGMFDAYTLCGNKQAFDVLLGMVDYFYDRMTRLPESQAVALLRVEFGGMNDILYQLYQVTGDPKHLKLAHMFDKMEFLEPLAKKQDNLTRRHGNTHIPIVIGAARRYELTGEQDYRAMAEFFWGQVVNTRSYAMGGSTVGERWTEPNRLAGSLATNNAECCKTHNMLKLTRILYGWNPDPAYADFYERAFFNGILGTQNPANGQMLYYVPLAPGSGKRFGEPYDQFWCCYGTGVETWAKQGDSIYFQDEGSIYVNLFIASTVDWTEKGVTIEQRTKFPEQEGTSLIVHAKSPVGFAMKVHVPYWATIGAKATLNGEVVKVNTEATSFMTVDRVWNEGDRLDIVMPMALHTHPMPDDPDMMAVMYGPLVLVGISSQRRPSPIISTHADFSSGIKPVGGKPLTFTMKTSASETTLVPLNRVIAERYTTYWKVMDPNGPSYQVYLEEQRKRAAREARVIDRVIPGNKKSESAHKQKGTGTEGRGYEEWSWRSAEYPGWWSYELKVTPDAPVILACACWPGRDGTWSFDILVDGRAIPMPVPDISPSERRTVEAEFPIPAELTKGKKKVTVTFKPHEEGQASIFSCVILKAE